MSAPGLSAWVKSAVLMTLTAHRKNISALPDADKHAAASWIEQLAAGSAGLGCYG